MRSSHLVILSIPAYAGIDLPDASSFPLWFYNVEIIYKIKICHTPDYIDFFRIMPNMLIFHVGILYNFVTCCKWPIRDVGILNANNINNINSINMITIYFNARGISCAYFVLQE
jgi:hypothetical protein